MVDGGHWDTEEAVQSEKGKKKGEGKGQDQACFPNHNNSNEKHKRSQRTDCMPSVT